MEPRSNRDDRGRGQPNRRSPDIIKIDIAGVGLEVLRSAEAVLKTKHPRIFFPFTRMNFAIHVSSF